MTFFPPDCASWLLEMEEDRPINLLSASKGLFPMLDSQDHLFKEALDWLQITYTVDRSGAYVLPASTVLTQSPIAEGGKLFPAIILHL